MLPATQDDHNRLVHFITHPEVVIDPAVPVTDWPLADEGVRRTRFALTQPWLRHLGSLFCSAERKATDTADIIGAAFGLTPIILPALGENDRSATGYLPKPAFEATADRFFAHPTDSIFGWERAIDAQQRIVAAVDTAISLAPPSGDIAIVSHGGVGALLLCQLRGEPISRQADQPAGGGGHVFSFRATDRRLIANWRRIEDPNEDGLVAWQA